MLAPTGFTQVIDSRAYMAAQTAMSRRVGLLRWTLPMILLAAAMLCGGGLLLWTHAGRLSYLLTAAVLLTAGATLPVVWIAVLPKAVAARAAREYRSYDRLQNPVEVSFTADGMTLKSAVLTRTVAFAKTRLCIDTPKRFVVLTDEGYTVILEKACFTQREAQEAFVRDVFARWIVRDKNG